MKTHFPLAILLITTSLCCSALAQNQNIPTKVETGKPLIRNYSPKEYHAAPDVWFTFVKITLG